MHADRARWLVSDAGQARLAALPPGLESLPATALATRLRQQHDAEAASALAEQVTLKARAAERIGSDLGMLFTAEGLEMMTHPLVAARRARRLAAAKVVILDLTCGIGGDLRACADLGAATIGLELDEATAVLAAKNVPGASIVRGDATRAPFQLAGRAIIIDPARRSAAGRRFDPAAFTPPWDVAVALLRQAGLGVLKAPPGVEHHHLPPEAETEFIQLGRSMREAAIWVGEGVRPGVTRAILLPAGAELSSEDAEGDDTTSPLGRYIYDPESCVTRASLVRHLAARLGAAMLDPQLAYLTSDAPAFDPLAATFEVIEALPFSVARLRDYLRANHLRPDEIRRRAFPIEPDELRKLLGKLEGELVTLLLTTIAGKRTTIIARRLAHGGGESKIVNRQS